MYLCAMEKTINEFKGYTFTECGKVYSYRKGAKKEIIGAKDKDGYLKITLVDQNGKFRYFRKHRLIMTAFLGISEMQVNHIDGNRLNNSLSNLEYVTQRENQSHRRKMKGYDVGVCWAKKENKWRSYIQIDKKWQHLGFYNEKHDAKNAYLNKLKELGIKNRYAI
jgi:hypothetical protein